MIGFKKIVGGSGSSVSGLTNHLLNNTLPVSEANVAAYYHRGMKSGVDDVFAIKADGTLGDPVAIVRPDLHPLAAAGLGITLDRPLSGDEINGLLAGRTTAGELIEGKAYAQPHRRVPNPKTGEEILSTPIGSYDFCPSPDKSVSCAWAFAPPSERALIFDAIKSSAREAVEYIATRVGVAHSEVNGEVQFIPGHVAWLEFTHFTARNTKTTFDDDGALRFTDTTVAGDMDVHVHHLIPNAIFCENGKVGSLHTGMIEGFIFAADAYFQSRLADKLLTAGFDVDLDKETGAARMNVIPDHIRRVFSKRSAAGEIIARHKAKEEGKDWDLLSPEERVHRIRVGAHSNDLDKESVKGGKDDVANFASWNEQAKRFGWTPPESFLRTEAKPELTDEQRHRIGYETALPLLAAKLERKSVITHWAIRDAAGRGLIPVGARNLADINAVTQMMRDEGVLQNGEKTALVWGHEAGARSVSVTTALHETQEKRFVELAKAMAADRSSAIPADLLDKAIAESGLEFSGEHGKSQLRMIRQAGSGGRLAVIVAAAGAGKTAAMTPIVAAKKELGWNIYGSSPPWRQADELTDSGIDPKNIRAFSVLLDELEQGKLKLGRNDLLIVDEVSFLGTRPGLRLLEMAHKHEFQVIALGDPKQVSELDAGSFLGLVKKAAPTEVWEIATTIRQQTDREKQIVGLLREGRAREAIEMKVADGTFELVPGDYDKVIARTAALYVERLAETGAAPTISAPTNYDAHRISTEVRKQRRGLGLVGEDVKIVRAGDNEGRHYGLAVAVGDNLRLFQSTGARFSNGRSGVIGRNGSVLEVLSVNDNGLMVKSRKSSRVGFVGWETLTAKRGKSMGRVLAAYADCMTIHAAQGSTSSEHILALPGGSQTIDGLLGYSAATRHRHRSVILTSDVAERMEVINRRALNDPRDITVEDKRANVARNISYQPVKDLAVSMLERVERVRRGTTNRFRSAVHSVERVGSAVNQEAVEHLKDAAKQEVPGQQTQDPPAAAPAETQAPQAAPAPAPAPAQQQPPAADNDDWRKSLPHDEAPLPPTVSQPKEKPPAMSAVDVQIAFSTALEDAGFRLKGAPIADNQWHRVAVDGDKGSQKSGSYRLWSTGGILNNFRGGDPVVWRPEGGSASSLSPEERAAQQAADRDARMKAQAEREGREEKVAGDALAAWKAAKPAHPKHDYLVRKEIGPSGLKQGAAGQTVPMSDGKEMKIGGKLVVPLRDMNGRIWNIQVIDRDGGKLFLPGRKKGLFASIGANDAVAVVVAEGFASAATVHKDTSLPVIAAIDVGNILPVALGVRSKYPDKAIIFAADNDHHLTDRTPPLSNAGIEKAKEAASLVGGVVVFPPRQDFGSKGTDWNDVSVSKGSGVSRLAMEAAFAEQGISELLPTRIQPGQTTHADREAARAVAAPVTTPRHASDRSMREIEKPTHTRGI